MHIFIRALIWFGLGHCLVQGSLCFAKSSAMSMDLGVAAGLMQQPTSNFYHFVRGGYLGLAFFDEALIARLVYVERPTYSYAGYLDQETFYSAGLGHGFLSKGSWVIQGYLGYGAVHGYLKSQSSGGVRRDFGVEGITLTMELGFKFSHYKLSVVHELCNGNGDETQTEARVSWPYSFYTIQLGARI